MNRSIQAGDFLRTAAYVKKIKINNCLGIKGRLTRPRSPNAKPALTQNCNHSVVLRIT